MRLIAVAAAAGVTVAVLLAGMIALGRSGGGQEQSAQPPARATATPSTVDPAALEVAQRFAAAFLLYDWSRPANPGAALQPYVTPRLYGSIVEEGNTPDGRPAPWTDVAPSLHEVDTVRVLRSTGQATGHGTTAVQLHVVESARTDRGQSMTPKELDLNLVRPSGTWLVDWATQRAEGGQ